MYDYLEGRVARRSAAGVSLDVNGLGFYLLVPLGTQVREGEPARLWTHLAVREDAHTLYGFTDRETRELFRALLKVKGVGPTMALAVLSGLTRSELVTALMAGDGKALCRVKGVGQRTADQILLDLRDRAPALAGGLELAPGTVVPTPPPTAEDGNLEDAATALVALGFSDKDARKRVSKAAETVDPADLEALVQAAFRG